MVNFIKTTKIQLGIKNLKMTLINSIIMDIAVSINLKNLL